MTKPVPGGRRRIDKVLDPGFVADLPSLSLPELRERRREAEQEETDLSYLRRMLHGRMSIVAAEMARRDPSGNAPSLVDQLAQILADDTRTTRGMGRHITIEPSRIGEHRRELEAVVADATLSDVTARSDAELAGALDRMSAHEVEISEVRRSVQGVMDALSNELAARYRDGRASVDDLIAPTSGG